MREVMPLAIRVPRIVAARQPPPTMTGWATIGPYGNGYDRPPSPKAVPTSPAPPPEAAHAAAGATQAVMMPPSMPLDTDDWLRTISSGTVRDWPAPPP